MAWTNLKAAIAAVVKTNNNQEITGANLQNVLNTIVNSLGANATFAGVAVPSTNPGTPDGLVLYAAIQAGTYVNFNNIVVQEGLTFLFWKNSTWTASVVFNKENMREIYDISAANNSASYLSLADALGTNGSNIPSAVRKSGMSIRFINSTTSEYEQWRYLVASIANTDIANVTNWQGVDDEPIENSKNLVTSGGVKAAIKTVVDIVLELYDVISEAESYPVNTTNLIRSSAVFPYAVDYDISAELETRYSDLSSALQSIPSNNKRQGMSIRFINSVTGVYENWRYLGTTVDNAAFLNIDNWQGIDDRPVINSKNLIKSGGVLEAINAAIETVLQTTNSDSFFICDSQGNVVFMIDEYGISKCNQSTNKDANDIVVHADLDGIGGAYDISAANDNASYSSLADALGVDGENVPNDVRNGGMSIRFINSLTSKYEQWRYLVSSTANADITNITNWQGVDNEPISNSKNLITSGGVRAAIEAAMSEISSLQDVDDDSFFVCDSSGNVVFMISSTGISKCNQSTNKENNDIVVHADIALTQFQQNTILNYYWDSNTSTLYSFIRINKERTDGTIQIPLLTCIAPSGNPQYSAKQVAINNGYFFVMNCALQRTNSHSEPEGVLIVNGQIINNAPTVQHGDVYILTIDSNGDLGYAEPNTDANTLIQNGVVSAFCGFAPLVVNYIETPHPEAYSLEGDHYNVAAMRQVIGQFENGDYAVITCEGRSNVNSVGWTVPEAAQICIKHGLKFAYNCDGGRSAQTVVGKKQINKDYSRKSSSYIYFNGKNQY